MNAADATRELEEIANAGDDFEWQSGQLTAKWEGDPKGFEAVEPILRFIKKHPDVDYGTPGPLVHFVETFPNYEESSSSLLNANQLRTLWGCSIE